MVLLVSPCNGVCSLGQVRIFLFLLVDSAIVNRYQKSSVSPFALSYAHRRQFLSLSLSKEILRWRKKRRTHTHAQHSDSIARSRAVVAEDSVRTRPMVADESWSSYSKLIMMMVKSDWLLCAQWLMKIITNNWTHSVLFFSNQLFPELTGFRWGWIMLIKKCL